MEQIHRTTTAGDARCAQPTMRGDARHHDPERATRARLVPTKTALLVVAATATLGLAACASSSPSPDASPTAASPTATAAPQWSYTGNTGPARWGDLSPDWATCGSGQAQSPIDLVTSAVSPGTAAPVQPQFTATDFAVENNGHTIEPVPATKDSRVVVDGVQYTFQQTHFHAPSEHTLNGQAFPMEMHLVSTNDQGNIAVIGLFIAAGAENTTLKEIFDNLPSAETTTATEYETGTPVNLGEVIPTAGQVFRYGGSLTTPPCSEGVQWTVYETPITLSAAQIAAFTSIYDADARPVQPLNGRTVSVYP